MSYARRRLRVFVVQVLRGIFEDNGITSRVFAILYKYTATTKLEDRKTFMRVLWYKYPIFLNPCELNHTAYLFYFRNAENGFEKFSSRLNRS